MALAGDLCAKQFKVGPSLVLLGLLSLGVVHGASQAAVRPIRGGGGSSPPPTIVNPTPPPRPSQMMAGMNAGVLSVSTPTPASSVQSITGTSSFTPSSVILTNSLSTDP